MEVKVQVSDYSQINGIADTWVNGYKIEVAIEVGEVIIYANKEGLASLAAHLLALSQDSVPIGYHLHFSQDYGLDDGSVDLILGRK